MKRTVIVSFALVAATLGACEGPVPEGRSAEALSVAGCTLQRFAWGQDSVDHLGFTAGGSESAARGPLAVGLDGGEAVVLDNQRARVVRVVGDSLRPVATIDRSAEDLALGGDGTLAVFSPLKAEAEVFGPSGEPLGVVPVPRALRSIHHLGVGASRQLYAVSALQEQVTLGSPVAPRELGSVLRSKVEGAHRHGSLGVSAVARNGRAELQLRRRSGERAELARSIPLPGEVTAAQLVSDDGPVACVRTESVATEGEALAVERRLFCVRLDDGRAVLDMPLPRPGPYLPRREIAVTSDGTVLRVAALLPANDGLSLARCEVAL